MLALCDVGELQIDPELAAWLDYETSQFIENELSEAADWHRQRLTDVCGSDDLFDLGAEMRTWWNEQVRAFRIKLVAQHRKDELIGRAADWQEDFELESRRQLAVFNR
jgi:hypothetical protein